MLVVATGSVARFDVRRGYGFVIPDDGGEDVFVHQNNIVMDGFRYLKAGEHVSYELEVGEKGMKAVSVQLLDPRPPSPSVNHANSVNRANRTAMIATAIAAAGQSARVAATALPAAAMIQAKFVVCAARSSA